MSRHLLDLNVLLALLDPLHVFHEAAHRWVETTPDLRFLKPGPRRHAQRGKIP